MNYFGNGLNKKKKDEGMGVKWGLGWRNRYSSIERQKINVFYRILFNFHVFVCLFVKRIKMSI